MIIISKISKKYYQILFLGIFLSFLSISIFHSHHFDLVTKSEIFQAHEKYVVDLFLDSELNCTITYLNNSLVNENDNIEFSNVIFEEEQKFTSDYFNKPITKHFYLFTLRGPPVLFI